MIANRRSWVRANMSKNASVRSQAQGSSSGAADRWRTARGDREGWRNTSTPAATLTNPQRGYWRPSRPAAPRCFGGRVAQCGDLRQNARRVQLIPQPALPKCAMVRPALNGCRSTGRIAANPVFHVVFTCPLRWLSGADCQRCKLAPASATNLVRQFMIDGGSARRTGCKGRALSGEPLVRCVNDRSRINRAAVSTILFCDRSTDIDTTVHGFVQAGRRAQLLAVRYQQRSALCPRAVAAAPSWPLLSFAVFPVLGKFVGCAELSGRSTWAGAHIASTHPALSATSTSRTSLGHTDEGTSWRYDQYTFALVGITSLLFLRRYSKGLHLPLSRARSVWLDACG